MNAVENSPDDISSGKDIAYENFPVGSWLLPAHLRPHIATFYHFARAADDIADSNSIEPEEKILRLQRFKETLNGTKSRAEAPKEALHMKASLAETQTAPQHCLDLLAAFKQDATKLRYQNWQELIQYCQLSAAPVGRYLLDLHGGSNDGYHSSDALCNALQILNHLQDCQDDYQTLNRVYLPSDILEKHGAKLEELSSLKSTEPLRKSFGEILAGVDGLLQEARKLPSGLKSRRLAMEAQVILNIAMRLSEKLRRKDLLTKRVKLSKSEYLQCFVTGLIQALFR